MNGSVDPLTGMFKGSGENYRVMYENGINVSMQRLFMTAVSMLEMSCVLGLMIRVIKKCIVRCIRDFL